MAGPLIWNGLNAKALTRDILLSNAFFNEIRVGNQFSHNSSTGVESGGVLSINADPTKFDLTAGSGTFIDYTVATVPTFKSISWNAFLAQTVTGLATQDETYILINNLGAIIQQSNYPTPNQRRVNIFIGRIGHTSRTTIQFATSFPDFSQSISSSTFDLFDALGPFNISGNEVLNNGANLTFQRTAGRMFFRSFNYPSDTYNPHTVTTASIVPALFNYRLRTGGPALPAVTAIDPGFYDVAGVRTVIPGGPNVATIQRVYLAPNGVMQVQYGQTIYPNISTAAASIGTDPFIQNPALTNVTILIAYIVVRAGALALNNPGDASILRAPKFETGVGGGVNTVTSLQQAYNSSTQPQIVLNSTGLGLQIHDNSTPIGTTLFQVANNAGTNQYLRVTAASVFSINVLNISNVSASTSPATGSITTTGGLGVSLDVNVGGTVTSGQIIDNGLTANTAVVANASKQLTSSTTTSTQLGFLSNVTSDIQAQINTKQGTNLILDPLFESGTVVQWSKGTIGAITNGLPTGTPTFGSGSSANLTISAVTSGQIQGTTSLSYASSATNVQGDMMATGAIPIDPEYRTKVLGIKFAYQLIAGTADFSGTSTNSWAWALYDVTNANFIGTAGQFNLVQSSGVGICTGTVQIPSNTASVRFIIYNVKATTGATTIYFDDFYFGPQVTSMGPAMSDWVPYTPTFTGFGTVTNVIFKSRRVGDQLEVLGTFLAGVVTAVRAEITIGYNGGNANVSIDPIKIQSDGSSMFVGMSVLDNAAPTTFGTYITALSAGGTFVTFAQQTSGTNPVASFAVNANQLIANNKYVKVQFSVPIVGWSSNSVSSSDTDTRVIAARYTNITPNSVGSSSNINLAGWVLDFDTTASMNVTSGVYTVSVSGKHRISSLITLDTTAYTAGISRYAQLRVFGTSTATLATTSIWATQTEYVAMSGSVVKDYKAGDTIVINLFNGTGSSVSLLASAADNWVCIERLSGPAVIQATSVVAANYVGTPTGTITSTFSTITYPTRVSDTSASYTSGTYSTPITGLYSISASVDFTATWAPSQFFGISIFVDGVEKYTNYWTAQAATTTDYLLPISANSIPLNAGQLVTIRARSNNGGATLVAGSTANFFSISRLGGTG